MTTEQMRARVSEAYPGARWRLRVLDMPDEQVIAIFKSMSRTGRFKRKVSKKKMEPGIRKAVQLTIFDLPEFQQTAT